jgi:hypothetical protein
MSNAKFVIKDTGAPIDLDQLKLEQPRYGTSRDMGDNLVAANPQCKCSPMQAMFCPYGHMLECHVPMTCGEAKCGHYYRYMANECDE